MYIVFLVILKYIKYIKFLYFDFRLLFKYYCLVYSIIIVKGNTYLKVLMVIFEISVEFCLI